MKVLYITTDTSLFDPQSSSYQELRKTAESLEQIHTVILTDKADLEIQQVDGKMFLYPANARSGLRSIMKAISVAELETVISSRLIVDLIVADDPFYSAAAAYYLSKKYRKNLLVNVFESVSTALMTAGAFEAWHKRKIANYVLPRSHGVRVLSQVAAEEINAKDRSLENRIYILPERLEMSTQDSTQTVDFNLLYPDFKLFIVTVVDTKSKQIKERLHKLIETLRIRYIKALLIVIDNNNLYKHKPSSDIAWISGVRNLSEYIKAAHVYVDVSNDSRIGGPLTSAALQGVPIVAAESPESTYVVRQEKNGFISNPDNLPEFCGWIAEIIETPGLRESMRIFRYEMDKMMVERVEDYNQSLLEIWQGVTQVKDRFKAGAVEVYTTHASYSLRATRERMHQIALKVDSVIDRVEKRIESPLGDGKRKNYKPQKVYNDNEVFDTTSILKK